MEILKFIFIGILQGITEFLPVSSSGHLIIFKNFLDLEQSLELDVMLHFATLLAVLLFYKQKLLAIVKDFSEDLFINEKNSWNTFKDNTKLALLIVLASLPAAFFGFLFKEFFEGFRSVYVVVLMLVVVAIYMYFSELIISKEQDLKKMNWIKALLIGFSQVIALIPGTSRSGITITTGSFLGLKKEKAADFSFLMSIPVILGSVIFVLFDVDLLSLLSINNLFAFFFSFVTGYFSIGFLLSILKKHGFMPFIIYRILLAFALLILLPL